MGNDVSRRGDEVRNLESAAFQISEGARALGQSLRPLAARWAANEERWQRTQQNLNNLETTLEAVAVLGASGEETVNRLEVRMSKLESSLEKALSSMFPRVEALLSQLEHHESRKNKPSKEIKERFLQNDSFATFCESRLHSDILFSDGQVENILPPPVARDVCRIMACEVSTKDGHSSGFVSKPSSPTPKKPFSVHRPIVLNYKPSSSNKSASSGTKPTSSSKSSVSGTKFSEKSKMMLINQAPSTSSAKSIPRKSKSHSSSKSNAPSNKLPSQCSVSELRSLDENMCDNSYLISSQSLPTDSTTSSETESLTNLSNNIGCLEETITSMINHSSNTNHMRTRTNQSLSSSSVGSFSTAATSSPNSIISTTIAISSSKTPSTSKSSTSKPTLLSPITSSRANSKTSLLNASTLQSSARESSLNPTTTSYSSNSATSPSNYINSISSELKNKVKLSTLSINTFSTSAPSTTCIPETSVSSTLNSTVLPNSIKRNLSAPDSLSSNRIAPNSSDSITSGLTVPNSSLRHLASQNTIPPNSIAANWSAQESSHKPNESNYSTSPDSNTASSPSDGSSSTDPEYQGATLNVQTGGAMSLQAMQMESEVTGLEQVVKAVPPSGQLLVAEKSARVNTYATPLRVQSAKLESSGSPQKSTIETQDAVPPQAVKMKTQDGGQSEVSADVEELLQAARNGDEERVAALLDAGVDVNAPCGGSGPYVTTVVHWAAAHARPRLLQMLLERGADPHGRDGARWTPLHVAAFGGSPRCICLLVAAGADVNSADDDGWTALHLAAVRGRSAATRALLVAGARSSDPDWNGKTPFDMATTDVIRRLLAEPAVVDTAP